MHTHANARGLRRTWEEIANLQLEPNMLRRSWVVILTTSVVVSALVPGQAMAQDPQEQPNEPPVVEEERKALLLGAGAQSAFAQPTDDLDVSLKRYMARMAAVPAPAERGSPPRVVPTAPADSRELRDRSGDGEIAAERRIEVSPLIFNLRVIELE